MQNLSIITFNQYDLGFNQKQIIYDEFSNQYYALSDKQIIYQFEIQNKQIKILFQKDLSSEFDEEIISFQFIVEVDSVIMISESGSFFKYNVQKDQFGIEGALDYKILAASWSPSQERLVVFTEDNMIYLFDAQFEVQKEIKFEEEFKSDQLKVSWRADSNFFSFNYGVEGGRKCVTKDSQLNTFQSTTKADEDEKGLVQTMYERVWKKLSSEVCYQPNGSSICGIENQNKLIFWEKNGLRHGDFELDSQIQNPVNIQFSKDSQILSIESDNNLYLFVRLNYYWYLKQTIKLQDDYKNYSWNQNLIIYNCNSFQIFQINLILNNFDSKNYIVVDNNKLNITQFEKQVIPPPMFSKQITNDKKIIAFSQKDSQFSYVLIDNQIILQDDSQIITQFQLKQEYQFIRHLLLLKTQIVFVCNYQQKQYLISINVQNQEIHEQLVNQNIINVYSYDDIAHFQIEDKYIIKYENKSVSRVQQQQQLFKKIQQYQKYIIGLSFNNQLYFDNRLVSQQCTSFFVSNDILYFTNNTSGMYQQLFIFDLTQTDGQLYVHLKIKLLLFNNLSLNELTVILDVNATIRLPESNGKSLNVRNIERGSQIVTVINEKLVFQLPRGNLELIYPRLAVLKQAKLNFLSGKYLKAFESLRQHKFDLNILYDMNPTYFLQNILQIIKDIQKTDFIILFLNQLNNQLSQLIQYILTKTEQQELKSSYQSKEIVDPNWKIKLICETFIQNLKQLDNDKYIYCIITCQIKKNDILSVFDYIQSVRSKEISFQQNLPPHKTAIKTKTQIKSQDLLQYVCWLVDADNVFDISLLTYDLELVAMVGQQTQKDPKEYLPFLEDLKKMEDQIEMKTVICQKLKKWGQMIQELAKGNQDQQNRSIEAIGKYEMFMLGMDIFKNDQQNLRKVQALFAEYLVNHGQSKQALEIYIQSQHYQQALDIAQNNGDFVMTLQISQFLKHSEEQRKQLIENLVQLFIETKDNKKLGLLYSHLQDYQNAVIYLAKSNSYQEISQIRLFIDQELIEKYVIPQLKLQFDMQMNYLKSKGTEVEQKIQRLEVVQQEKRSLMELRKDEGKDSEVISVYSLVSMSSYYSDMTIGGSKKKVKKPKNLKDRKLKEGSPMEEQFLVEVLTDIQMNQETLDKVEKLVEYLLLYLLPNHAKQLYNQAFSFAKLTNHKYQTIPQIEFQKQNQESLTYLYPDNKDYQPKLELAQIKKMFNKYSYLLD